MNVSENNRVRREMIRVVVIWSCKKNGYNKDTKRTLKLKFKDKGPME
jgi:hypothetical protein